MNKIPQIVLGVIWLIASLMLIIYGWTMITDISELFVDDSGNILDTTFYAMYWIGITLMIFLCAILPPYWLIINAYKEEEQ